MKLGPNSDDGSIGTSLGQFNAVALVAEGSMEKVGHGTGIEVSFRVDEIVAFGFATSVVLGIS